MYIWTVYAFDMEKDKTVEFAMDDSNMLLDCICDNVMALYTAIISMSLKECDKRNLDFNGFEIVAC